MQAKQWLTSAIETAPGLGGGHGPVNHHAPFLGGAARASRGD